MKTEEIIARKSKVLTLKKKLSAIALKYYHHLPWVPKKGDYYTSSREDLELYIVVDVDDKYVYTEYTKTECTTSKWEKSEFLLGFGLCRVYIPDFIMDMEEPAQSNKSTFLKTDEEIREEASKLFPIELRDIEQDRGHMLWDHDVNEYERNLWVQGATWANESAQSSMEVEIERRANEKVEEWKKNLIREIESLNVIFYEDLPNSTGVAIEKYEIIELLKQQNK